MAEDLRTLGQIVTHGVQLIGLQQAYMVQALGTPAAFTEAVRLDLEGRIDTERTQLRNSIQSFFGVAGAVAPVDPPVTQTNTLYAQTLNACQELNSSNFLEETGLRVTAIGDALHAYWEGMAAAVEAAEAAEGFPVL